MYEYHLLEWTYTPADFFEEPLDLVGVGYTVKVENGQIEARIEASHYPSVDSLAAELQEALRKRFQAAQVFSRRQFSLSQSSLTSVGRDGGRHIMASVKMTAGARLFASLDLGSCNRDYEDERRKKEQLFADQVAKLSGANPVVAAVLDSYTAATNDPANELIYLYEVRDALAQHFGSDSAARAATGVSRKRWSRLGKLANEEPLSQGRHRGAQIGALRDATEEELAEAGSITRELIEGLLRHLDGLLAPSQPPPTAPAE